MNICYIILNLFYCTKFKNQKKIIAKVETRLYIYISVLSKKITIYAEI